MPAVATPETGLASGLVVVGASAGGIEAVSEVVSGLPADLDACVLVVVHVPATGTSALPAILDRRSALDARHARDGDVLAPGQVLVAPPDHHLVVDDGRVSLTRGPQENGHRPAVDVLFRSAARSWGARTIGVVLSGTLDDGAAGVVAIEAVDGRSVVQSDPLFDGMPRAATRADDPQTGVPAREIPELLVRWLAELPVRATGAPTSASRLMDREIEMAELRPGALHDPDRPGVPAGFGCPECAGSLFRIEEGALTRFRCRVGHAWSSESLLARQGVALESALWTALRSLEEKAALNTELGRKADERGHDHSAARYRASAREATDAAELVRGLVTGLGDLEAGDLEAGDLEAGDLS